MAGSSSSQDEHILVERVFLRIGSAETDEQLETALGKFLTPVLIKLNSQEEGIRKKVMELLVHVNKRLKSRPKVQLPVEALMTQYQDPQATPFVTNFTILYIKMGYPRLSPEKQADMLPILINCLGGRPQQHQDSLLQLVIPALQHLKMPQNDDQRKAKFGFGEKPLIVKLLLDYMMDVLILTYSSHVAAIDKASQPQRAASAPIVRAAPVTPPPPGLSEQAFKRVTGENPFNPEALEKAKLGIVKFLGTDVFPEKDIVCHYVIASSDTRHSVATQADMELKRITGSVNWNSPEIIKKLYSVFQGTVVVKGKEVKADQRRTPACTRIRLKIFPIFLKSTEAANTFPSCIQVVFDCLFGPNPNQKLKNMAVQLVHHICFSCEVAKFSMFDAVLLSGMIKLINEAKEDPKLRGLAYIAVGKIARKSPHRVTKDITLAQQFFNSVCQEDSDTRLAVQEALSMMSEAFKQLDDTNKKLMEALIMQSIDKPESQVRLVAVQYAIAVFSPDHIPSRYVLLIAAGDLKEDIRSEALKSLHGKTRSGQEDKEVKLVTLPDFTEMITYIQEKADQRKQGPHRYVSGASVMPFNPTTYSEMVLYLRKCLVHAVGVTPDEDSTAMQNQAPSISKYVNQLLTKYSNESGPIQRYVTMLRQLLSSSTTPQVMYCLLEVVAVAANNLAPRFVEHTDWIKTFISSSKDDIRGPAAQLFAIVIMYSGKDNLIQQAMEEFTSNLKNKNVEMRHGSLLGLGYLIGHLIRKQSCDMETDSVVQQSASVLQEQINKAVLDIATMVKTSEQSLLSSVCVTIGEICRNGVLPMPSGAEDDKEDETTKLSLVKNLINIIETSKETAKVKEKAVVCLGYMCIGDPEFPHRRKIIADLLNAVQDKQVELHFTIGDSVVCAALGCRSPAARSMWTQTEEEFALTVMELKDDVDWYLTKLLNTYIPHANPHLRQAACIWLLSLVRQCGSHESMQQQIKSVQRAFMQLLSENDEITQDVASKGLGLVYEKCTSEQKDSLVSELVDTLMTGKRPQQEVTGETQIFQEGALGKTPEGSSLSTYKELCAIANDLNQPDLIYKFMHLANHNAMWNSRRGAAFGFSTIATQAGEQLAPYLPQIVPRLYRYQFDPNPKIQQAMSSIWNALVQDNKKTVDTYIQQIVIDLLKNLTSNQWRIRESSCIAVTDLLRGRPVDEIVHLFPELWETCLKVRDDIKESVRNAADLACKSLSRVSIKICDPSHGSVGEKATSVMLPCLLNNSIQSSVPEVRAIGLSTLLQISKNAGVLMKPHIPVLVTALLEAVSGLEPQVMNYLSFHVSSQATQEKLDSARIAASKMSPMMETINRCVQYVDESVLPELVPRLTDLIKSGIGVGTKAGCASFVVSLVHQCPNDVTPHAGKLMGAFLHGLADRNLSVRKAYASALGKLAKIAKDSSLEKLITKLKSYYLEKEDEVFHVACGLTLRAMSQHSSDALRRHATLAMPLAFFAMHEKHQDDSNTENADNVWEEVWQEVTPGTEAGLRLYLPEIVVLLHTSLDSQLWSTKAQAAAAMSTMATKLGSTLGSPHLGEVLKALLNGLQGRTWEGKETLLQAISTVCTSCKEAIMKGQEGQATTDEIIEAMLKECKKEKPAYKIEALKCLGVILEAYKIDRFIGVWEIVNPIIQKGKSSEKDKDEEVSSVTTEAMKDCVYSTVGQAWPTQLTTQATFQLGVSLELCSAIPLSTWRVQVTILKAIHKFIDRLCGLDSEVEGDRKAVESIIQNIVTAVIPSLGNMKYSAIRSESLTVIEVVIKKLTEANRLETIATSREQLMQELSTLSKDGVWDVREKANKVLDMTSVTS